MYQLEVAEGVEVIQTVYQLTRHLVVVVEVYHTLDLEVEADHLMQEAH